MYSKGNFPQALTYPGLISAACYLDRALTAAEGFLKVNTTES
jgi:hypothetical protein